MFNHITEIPPQLRRYYCFLNGVLSDPKKVLASDAGLEPAVDPDDANLAVISEKGHPNIGSSNIRVIGIHEAISYRRGPGRGTIERQDRKMCATAVFANFYEYSIAHLTADVNRKKRTLADISGHLFECFSVKSSLVPRRITDRLRGFARFYAGKMPVDQY